MDADGGGLVMGVEFTKKPPRLASGAEAYAGSDGGCDASGRFRPAAWRVLVVPCECAGGESSFEPLLVFRMRLSLALGQALGVSLGVALSLALGVAREHTFFSRFLYLLADECSDSHLRGPFDQRVNLVDAWHSNEPGRERYCVSDCVCTVPHQPGGDDGSGQCAASHWIGDEFDCLVSQLAPRLGYVLSVEDAEFTPRSETLLLNGTDLSAAACAAVRSTGAGCGWRV